MTIRTVRPIVHTATRRPSQAARSNFLDYASCVADACAARGQDVSAGTIRALVVKVEELMADKVTLQGELRLARRMERGIGNPSSGQEPTP